jgi:hypothetical protein
MVQVGAEPCHGTWVCDIVTCNFPDAWTKMEKGSLRYPPFVLENKEICTAIRKLMFLNNTVIGTGRPGGVA